MKKKLLLIGSAALLMPMLTGCESVGKAANDFWNWEGPGYHPEPGIGRAAPLVVPPDFAMTPSQSGPPKLDGTQEQTLDAIFGGPAQRSNTERAIGANGTAEAGIRSSVGDPDTVTVNKGLITRDILAAPEGDGQYAQAGAGGGQ